MITSTGAATSFACASLIAFQRAAPVVLLLRVIGRRRSRYCGIIWAVCLLAEDRLFIVYLARLSSQPELASLLHVRHPNVEIAAQSCPDLSANQRRAGCLFRSLGAFFSRVPTSRQLTTTRARVGDNVGSLTAGKYSFQFHESLSLSRTRYTLLVLMAPIAKIEHFRVMPRVRSTLQDSTPKTVY